MSATARVPRGSARKRGAARMRALRHGASTRYAATIDAIKRATARCYDAFYAESTMRQPPPRTGGRRVAQEMAAGVTMRRAGARCTRAARANASLFAAPSPAYVTVGATMLLRKGICDGNVAASVRAKMKIMPFTSRAASAACEPVACCVMSTYIPSV